MKHLYFEEKVCLTETDLLTIQEEEVVVTELKSKLEEVIPLGYIFEDFMHHYTNSSFEMKNSFRLRNNNKIKVGKLDYMVASNEPSNNLIRDYAVNQEIFMTVPILTQNHLPQDIHPPMSKPLPITRINQTFASRNYLQKLK